MRNTSKPKAAVRGGPAETQPPATPGRTDEAVPEPEVDEFRPTSRRTQLLILLAAVATAVTVILTMLPSKLTGRAAQAAAEKASAPRPCTEAGAVAGCIDRPVFIDMQAASAAAR